MELQYLGTAAAEGIPALFCDCKVCLEARRRGGRNIRTRSQALLDGELLIDFPADSYFHSLREGIELSHIRHCLITHSHADHLYPEDINMRIGGFAYPAQGAPLTFYGSPETMVCAAAPCKESTRVAFCPVEPFAPFPAGRYTVTALPAHHAPSTHPYIYLITDGEKTLLYAHDTGPFFDEVWDRIAASVRHIDFVSLDCTNGNAGMNYDTHMNLERNVAVRTRLTGLGKTDAKTLFCCNHFSHNGGTPLYEEFSEIAAREGFLTSYDGMKVSF